MEAQQNTQTQPYTNGVPQPTDEQRNISALDAIISETERAAKERIIVRRAELDYQQRLARAFAESGCFSDIKDIKESVAIARALVKIKLGESMGFSEAESMSGIDIIQGRLAIGAYLRGARMQRAGFSWPKMICTNEGCWMPLEFKGQPMMQQRVNDKGEPMFTEKGDPVMTQVVVCYTKADATAAGLIGKDNYKKNPSDMYFARCVTRAQRRYAPGVLSLDILSAEEARDLPLAENSAPFQASISLNQVTAGKDENRGHDATNPANGNGEAKMEPAKTGADAPVKHLGSKKGNPIFSGFPPKNQLSNGQKLWVRQSTGEDVLYTYDSEAPDESGEPGAFVFSFN